MKCTLAKEWFEHKSSNQRTTSSNHGFRGRANEKRMKCTLAKEWFEHKSSNQRTTSSNHGFRGRANEKRMKCTLATEWFEHKSSNQEQHLQTSFRDSPNRKAKARTTKALRADPIARRKTGTTKALRARSAMLIIADSSRVHPRARRSRSRKPVICILTPDRFSNDLQIKANIFKPWFSWVCNRQKKIHIGHDSVFTKSSNQCKPLQTMVFEIVQPLKPYNAHWPRIGFHTIFKSMQTSSNHGFRDCETSKTIKCRVATNRFSHNLQTKANLFKPWFS
jgi:hypothetical protein